MSFNILALPGSLVHSLLPSLDLSSRKVRCFLFSSKIFYLTCLRGLVFWKNILKNHEFLNEPNCQKTNAFWVFMDIISLISTIRNSVATNWKCDQLYFPCWDCKWSYTNPFFPVRSSYHFLQLFSLQVLRDDPEISFVLLLKQVFAMGSLKLVFSPWLFLLFCLDIWYFSWLQNL